MTEGSPAPEIENYTFVRWLGSGGFATVFLYQQRDPTREVAVKVVNTGGLTEDMGRQFLDEANAMARVSDHPYIADVFAVGMTRDGRPYIAMKYYAGPTFAVLVKERLFSVPQTLRAGVWLSSAIESAHRAGVLHRDIKPANILTDLYGRPALTDFGIAVTSDQTRSGAEGMSLPWAPRETVFGGIPDERSDVYSLAATLWHLLVGRSPFEQPGSDNSARALMHRIDATAPRPTGRPDVPSSLERVLASALAKTPDDRPGSALDLARSLQAVEQELKLPKTELLLQEQATPRSRPSQDDETRVRAPQRVSPHREPATDSAQVPERVRVASRQVAPDATIRRQPIAATPEPSSERLDESIASGRRRTRKGVLVAAAILLAAVGAVVVIVLVGGSPKTPPIDRRTTERVVPQQVGLSAPPGTPVVSGRRINATTASFRWRYANPVAHDSFRWRSSGTAAKSTRGTAIRRELDVSLRHGATVCLSVQVIRSDGSDPSAFSPPACVH